MRSLIVVDYGTDVGGGVGDIQVVVTAQYISGQTTDYGCSTPFLRIMKLLTATITCEVWKRWFRKHWIIMCSEGDRVTMRLVW